MFFKTVTKLVRNSYEYSWNSASPRCCDEFTTVCRNLFGSTAIKLEYAECMHEPTEYKQIFVSILDNSWYFFFSRYHLCLQDISCKMNASHITAVVMCSAVKSWDWRVLGFCAPSPAVPGDALWRAVVASSRLCWADVACPMAWTLRSLKQQNYISDSFSVFILLRSNQKCKYIHDTNRINQTYVHTNSFPFKCVLK